MRLATFNVENLFDRAKAMNFDTWTKGKVTLENFSKLNTLLGEATYTDSIKNEMVTLLTGLGLKKSDIGPFVILRRNRGSLLKRPKTGPVVITANGRFDWTGSLELRTEPVKETAILNTARVIKEVNADILAVIEAEDRPGLAQFNSISIPSIQGTPYAHIMLIDGNDSRGIDVGILTKKEFPIGNMRSHADEYLQNGEKIFSRDCPEYEISTPLGNTIIIIINHFKSKGYGTPASSDARRQAQAQRVKEIYQNLSDSGHQHIAIVGDFNDTPVSAALAPLLSQTNLKDVFHHVNFDQGGHLGTYGGCTASNKIDYILLSPSLFSLVQGGSVFRKGMWPGVRPAKWSVFQEIKSKSDIASDHAAVWVDIDI